MIKTVFLDIDDTLLDFRKAEALAIRHTFIELGVEPTDELIQLYSGINLSQWKLLEKGEITRAELLTRRFDILYSQIGLDISSQKTQSLYEENLSHGAYFLDGAEELLQALCGKYELYITSNGTAYVQSGRIKISGMAKYFKDIFISELVGFDKPSKAFFDACFAKIPGLEKDKSIVIGDSLTSDIQGGINAGIKTCWFNPHRAPKNPEIPADYEIHELSEIPALLERI